MRKLTTSKSPALIAALGVSLTLAACGGAADDTAAEGEPAEMQGIEQAIEANDTVTGAEIEEAVPGVEGAAPEGDTPNTADLDEPENINTNEIGEDQ